MCLLGILGGILGYLGSSLGPVTLGAHTMLGSSLFVISGYQAVLMHLLSLDLSQKLEMRSSENNTFLQKVIMSQGARICLLLFFSGVLLWGKVFLSWQLTDFGQLDYAITMKLVIPGATLISLSLEMMIFTFFRSWVRVEINS